MIEEVSHCEQKQKMEEETDLGYFFPVNRNPKATAECRFPLLGE